LALKPCGSESDRDRNRDRDRDKRRDSKSDSNAIKDIALAIGTGPSRTYLAHKMLRLKNAKVEICAPGQIDCE